MSSAQGTVLEPIDEFLEIIIAIKHFLLKKRQEEEKIQIELDELKELEKELDFSNETIRNYMYAFFSEEMILTELAEAADRGGRADLTFIDTIVGINGEPTAELDNLRKKFQCEYVNGRLLTKELSKDDIRELIFENNIFSKKININNNGNEKELFNSQKCSDYFREKYEEAAKSKQSLDAWKNNFGKSFEKLSANDIVGLGYARFRDSYANVVFKMQTAEVFNRHPNLLKKHEGEVTIHNYYQTGEDKVYKIADIDRSIVAEMKNDVNFQLMQQKLQLWKIEKESDKSKENDKAKLSKNDLDVLNKIQEKVKVRLEKDEYYLNLNEEDRKLMEQSLVKESFKEYQILKSSHEKMLKEEIEKKQNIEIIKENHNASKIELLDEDKEKNVQIEVNTQDSKTKSVQEKSYKDQELEELIHEYEHSDFSSEESKVDFAKKVAQSDVCHDFLKNVDGGELKEYIVASTVLELEERAMINHYTNETFSQYYQDIMNVSGFSNQQIKEYVDNFAAIEKHIKLTLEVENEGSFELTLPFENNEE